MTITFLPLCRICNDKGWFRHSDPAGRGDTERCQTCNPPDPAIEFAKQEAHERELMAAALAVLAERKRRGKRR